MVTAVAFFKRLWNGVTIFPGCTQIDGIGRVLLMGTDATLDEHAQEVSVDRQVAGFDNSAAPSVLGLQARCGK